MNKKSREEEGACYLARQMKPIKAGHPDYLHNLQNSLQNENAGPPFPKSIKNIKTATAEHKASMGPFPRAGPYVTAQVTNPQSLFCWLSVGEATGLSVQISSRWASERKIVK